MKNKATFLMFWLVVLVGTLVACKSSSVPQPTQNQTKIETKIIIKDTVFKIEKDSSFYEALLECQQGKVVLIETPKTQKGKSLKPPKVSIKQNLLSVDCQSEAQKLLAKWKEKHQNERQTTIYTRTIKIEKKLSFWQHTQIWFGRIFMLLLTYNLVKAFKK